MKSIKKYTLPLAIALIAIVVAIPVLLFARFRQNDARAFTDFFYTYQQFDKAVSDVSASQNDEASLERQADIALTELKTTASAFRLTSLVENDATLMDEARQIAEVSERELESLRAYKQAAQSKSADADMLGKAWRDLSGQRQAAYTRFRELAGLEG